MKRSLALVMAVLVGAVPLVLAAAGIVLMAAAGIAPQPELGNLGMNAVVAVAFPLVGAVILRHRPGHRLAWVYCAAGLGAASAMFTYGYGRLALESGPLPGGVGAAWVSSWVWTIGVMPLVTFGLLLFPDGRLPSPRWRLAAAGALAGVVFVAVSNALAPGPLVNHPQVVNPLGVAGASPVLDALGSIGFVLFSVAFFGAVGSLAVRWRSGSTAQRRQLRWLLYAVVLLAFAFVVDLAAPSLAASALAVTAMIFLPVAVGLAIVRERLYDIDVLISRSLVYGTLTAGVVVTYVVVVAAVGGLLGRGAGLAGPLIATGIVAVAFQPAREFVQRRVSRLVYGPQKDPYAALARLARRLEATTEPDAVLPTVVETVADSLRLPYAAVELVEDGRFRQAASYGAPTSINSVLLLTHQGRTIGRMVLGRRSADEPLTGVQRRLLEDLARQVGIAVHAIRLTSALQSSRQRLISAREEERRRLHRDLHDGLGPTLAATTLQFDLLRRLILESPDEAQALAEQLKADMQAAIAEVRRIVYALRPPALEELGLVGALRQHTLGLRPPGLVDGVEITVSAAGELPPLSAAVEVAAYRISTEAITNVVRHAGARRCTVQLACDDGFLRIEVSDDGTGISADHPPGVGLASMRERAAELGGHCSIALRPDGGTVVCAYLPLGAS